MPSVCAVFWERVRNLSEIFFFFWLPEKHVLRSESELALAWLIRKGSIVQENLLGAKIWTVLTGVPGARRTGNAESGRRRRHCEEKLKIWCKEGGLSSLPWGCPLMSNTGIFLALTPVYIHTILQQPPLENRHAMDNRAWRGTPGGSDKDGRSALG